MPQVGEHVSSYPPPLSLPPEQVVEKVVVKEVEVLREVEVRTKHRQP